jgi:S-adenosylmethionine:tRNA ribosyltransferase-isomerase
METVFVTLHVGLGTFLPVRTENVEGHKMHEEAYNISEEAACAIEKAKAEGRKILDVGTTSLRTLESAWMESPSGSGSLRRGEGSTSIFIYPGYTFKAVDCMFTNFHTPASTLLMLVSAFADRDFILESYKEAIKKGYRFFSYGDACLIL